MLHSRGVMDFRPVTVEGIVIFIVLMFNHGLCGQTMIMHYYDKYDYD
jgi:hypothetical protein